MFSWCKYETKNVRDVSLAPDKPTGPYLCFYQILSKYFKPLRRYEVHKKWLRNLFRADNYKKAFVLLECDTLTWYMSLPNIIKSQTVWELWPAEDFDFRGDTEESESCLSCIRHLFWSLSMPLPNIIRIFQTIKKLWCVRIWLRIPSVEITRKKK